MFGSVSILAVGKDMRAAERFRAIAKQHQRLGSGIRNLVIILCAKKQHVVFFDWSLVAFNALDRARSFEHEKSLRAGMIMHVRSVTRNEVEHPGAEIVGSEKVDLSLLVVARFGLFFAQVVKVHYYLLLRKYSILTYRHSTPQGLTIWLDRYGVLHCGETRLPDDNQQPDNRNIGLYQLRTAEVSRDQLMGKYYRR